MSRGLVGALDERDRRHRAELAERKAALPLTLIQNQCTKVLLQLDDPKDALLVVERLRRSIAEFIAAEARGPMRVG